MKLLISSPAFLPLVGGLETAAAQLAEGLAQRGHEVVVATETAGDTCSSEGPYRTVRRPSAGGLLRLTRRCEVFYQANVSLRYLWPLFVVRRPWVVSHHTWYRQSDGQRSIRDRLKVFLLRYATASIAVSRAVAADLPWGAIVIENAYRDRLFRRLPEVPRDRDLVFVGRLVSDKGVDVLLDALRGLRQSGVRPGLSIIGDGPERAALEARARELSLGEQVDFLGLQTGENLVRLLNGHEILVVPSRYNEPFGIVALEGIACGCVVLGTAGGGLPEAIGPCGMTVPNHDAPALAGALARLLGDPDGRQRLRARAGEHLATHREVVVVDRYAKVLETALGS